ncbi:MULTISPECIES: hypothetical protein [Paenibacillus]|uniref:Uncharacterized protein n=1 Tax=Paenibacillus naphthalenovorans TaxID=162209 RepID=A0A0U2IN06_9BACL|nr:MULTISPECIES: hypothetical protein [Paenibacillus]ALS23787.1 hypothetical protein IJ22_34260 [Paenibacillus naphthalenovorans]NTZ19275.1 hypothetical protein [Paenibacillus sp. JMULE4]GCL74612.1 hypothetical protein PN4B1_45670 [Paenibacillus naphthalenovorans]SDJ67385.1 hypothetical protein SAMN05421868_13714 [Paenibacillus naphthalenovorans]
MTPIHPISEKVCKAFYGKPVCVILKNGAQFIGTLSRWEKGKLILNDEPAVKLQSKTKKSRAGKGRTGSKASKAAGVRTAAVPAPLPQVPPFGGSRMEFIPSRIAWLLALI